MKLKVLGSSSAGNCYILENDSEALIIEAGISFKEVKKALDFNVRKIVGVISSHSHKDHSRYIHEYERAGIPVFKPYESEMDRQVRTYGKFVIKSFEVVHDVPCCGFLIEHPEMGKLLFVTDTEFVKYRFDKQNISHIMVEANYSDELLTDEPTKRTHVLTGHMKINTACDFIEANRTAQLRNVVLIHLSDSSSDAEQFMAMAEKVAKCPVYVAEKGLNVSFDLVPF